jgi:3-phenylpropionate/trans-cinnamate dioxygenase ferredoxin reductase subunit
VKAVVTESGKQVECDAVVVGAGVRPDVMLAQKAGLEVDDGITCDAKLQTSVEGIYAAGDVCSYDSVIHGRRLRVEHWDVALQQGQAAGANMLGEDKDYDVVPYFFSDLADWASLEYVGPAEDWDEIVWRGERDSGEFSAWYLKDGKVAGCLSVERSEDLARARELLAEGTDVSADREKIADPGTDLGEIG